MTWFSAAVALGCVASVGFADAPATRPDAPATQPAPPQVTPSPVAATEPDTRPAAGLWDSSRYLRVSEVRPGMVGYGLTVFSGTRIDKFDVEVVDVLHNFNPKHDVVLISCKGPYLEHVGSVAGMSGSPIYLYDEADAAHAHPRMIGAFAYGWPLAKDPVAGVQPIEYMLQIPPNAPDAAGGGAAVRPPVKAERRSPRRRGLGGRWTTSRRCRGCAAPPV